MSEPGEVNAGVQHSLIREILEAICQRDGVSLDSSAEPGTPARNYELAIRLGIGHVFGIPRQAAAPHVAAQRDLIAAYHRLYEVVWNEIATVDIDYPGHNGISYDDSTKIEEAAEAVEALLNSSSQPG